MKNEVRYEDYHIGRDVYTVKLTHQPHGVVYVQVMKWHLPPRNLWERITEWWKYILHEGVWYPTWTDVSLDVYCIDQCTAETKKRIAIKRGDKDWEAF